MDVHEQHDLLVWIESARVAGGGVRRVPYGGPICGCNDVTPGHRTSYATSLTRNGECVSDGVSTSESVADDELVVMADTDVLGGEGGGERKDVLVGDCKGWREGGEETKSTRTGLYRFGAPYSKNDDPTASNCWGDVEWRRRRPGCDSAESFALKKGPANVCHAFMAAKVPVGSAPHAPHCR